MTANKKTVERTVWIDICKGLCILLVVYGHISGGLAAAGTLSNNSLWMKMRDWVYLFHMPAFFALSGIFAARLSQLSFRDFMLNRLRTIIYPYLVWTAILVGSQVAMVKFVNNPPDFSRALRFLVEPYGYGLWFLYSLFLISLIYYFLARLEISPLIILLLAMSFSCLASFNIFGLWPIFNTAMNFFIYYVAAAIVSKRISSIFSGEGWLKPLVFGFALMLAMTIVNLLIGGQKWPFNFILAWLGIAGVICLAKGIGVSLTCRFWAFLGLFSLEIYLGHPLWGTIARILLHIMRINSPVIFVFGGVCIGIGGSLLVGLLCQVIHWPYLFKWPSKKPSLNLHLL